MATSSRHVHIGRYELLQWVNNVLQTDYTKVEQCSDGVAYAQLLDAVYPGKVPLHRLNFNAQHEEDHQRNLRILSESCSRLEVEVSVPVMTLAKGKFQDNFDFLKWFYAYASKNGVSPATTPGSYEPYRRRVEAQERQKTAKGKKKAAGARPSTARAGPPATANGAGSTAGRSARPVSAPVRQRAAAKDPRVPQAATGTRFGSSLRGRPGAGKEAWRTGGGHDSKHLHGMGVEYTVPEPSGSRRRGSLGSSPAGSGASTPHSASPHRSRSRGMSKEELIPTNFADVPTSDLDVTQQTDLDNVAGDEAYAAALLRELEAVFDDEIRGYRDMKNALTVLQSERNDYFDRLRSIEIICELHPNSAVSQDLNEVLSYLPNEYPYKHW